MALAKATFADAWKEEFDRMSAGINWLGMTVPGRARILNRFKEEATKRAILRVRRNDVYRSTSADVDSIERKFVRRAHRLGVTRSDLRHYE